MLATRLASGSLLVVVLIAILGLDEWLAPWFPLWFAASVAVMVLCAREVAGLLAASGTAPSTGAVVGGTLAIVVANWAPHLIAPTFGEAGRVPPDAAAPSASIAVMAWPLCSFVACLMATFLVQSASFRRPGATTAAIAGTTLVLAYIGLLGGFIIQMRWFEGPYHGLVPLALLIATAKGSDTGAYTIGRIAGRHKLWPTLSPNKTVEGALGGLAAGVVAALAVAAVARFVLHAPCLAWGPAVAFGLVVALMAQLGDLMESMLKRDSELKDASSAVPGFGGLLDVMDSLLFSAPVAYGFWIWFSPEPRK